MFLKCFAPFEGPTLKKTSYTANKNVYITFPFQNLWYHVASYLMSSWTNRLASSCFGISWNISIWSRKDVVMMYLTIKFQKHQVLGVNHQPATNLQSVTIIHWHSLCPTSRSFFRSGIWLIILMASWFQNSLSPKKHGLWLQFVTKFHHYRPILGCLEIGCQL